MISQLFKQYAENIKAAIVEAAIEAELDSDMNALDMCELARRGETLTGVKVLDQIDKLQFAQDRAFELSSLNADVEFLAQGDTQDTFNDIAGLVEDFATPALVDAVNEHLESVCEDE